MGKNDRPFPLRTGPQYDVDPNAEGPVDSKLDPGAVPVGLRPNVRPEVRPVAPPRPTRPPSSSRPPHRVDENKNDWNLLRSRGELDFLSWGTCVVGLTLLMAVATPLAASQIAKYRASLDELGIARTYGVWFFGCCIVVAMYGNVMIKRWARALDVDRVPLWLALVIRGALMSPLLAIWALIVTIAVPETLRWKDDFHDRLGSRLFGHLCAFLLLFHLGYIGWQIKSGQVIVTPSYGLRPADPKNAEESLRFVRGAGEAGEKPKFVTQAYLVHVQPYLSPIAKLGLAFGEDMKRSQWIESESQKTASALCQRQLGYLGMRVDDCFFFNYRKTHKSNPFVSPLMGLQGETKYRQAVNTRLAEQAGETPTDRSGQASAEYIGSTANEENVANGLLYVSNVLSLMEFRTNFAALAFQPMGLLRYNGSPEVALVGFLEDAQRYQMIKKMLPQLKPQLERIEKIVTESRAALKAEFADAAMAEIAVIHRRVERLEQDPLQLQTASAP